MSPEPQAAAASVVRRAVPGAPKAPDALAELLAPLAGDLEAVEAIFERELVSELECVSALVRHVSRFRGKMLRPMLLLLAARAARPGEPVGEDTLTLAAVVEMVHMSTLVHDDVLDEAELRRKGATINHLRGNEAAVLLGDYLISHSYHLCNSVTAPPPLEAQFAARLIGRTTNRLCEGELLQIEHRNDLALSEEMYYEIIRRKTGELTAASALLGAAFAGADETTATSLHRYGLLVGTAFQVQDDVLDLVGDSQRLGKTLGLDAEKQKLTLPLIHFLRTAPARHRELLRSLLRSGEVDRIDKIRNLICPAEAWSTPAPRRGGLRLRRRSAWRAAGERGKGGADVDLRFRGRARALNPERCEFWPPLPPGEGGRGAQRRDRVRGAATWNGKQRNAEQMHLHPRSPMFDVHRFPPHPSLARLRLAS